MEYAIIIAISVLIIEHVLMTLYIINPNKDKDHGNKSKSNGK